MKKIILLFLFIILAFSCGKKDDPIYKESKNLIQSTIIG